MTLKVVTSWQTLMQYAHALGQVRLSGDEARIAEAQLAHDNYKQACLDADEMLLGCTMGSLSDAMGGRRR